jgi:hypothetical protein
LTGWHRQGWQFTGCPPIMAPEFDCMGFHTSWGFDYPFGMFWSQFSHWTKLCIFPSFSCVLDCSVFGPDCFGYDHWRPENKSRCQYYWCTSKHIVVLHKDIFWIFGTKAGFALRWINIFFTPSYVFLPTPFHSLDAN